ncbi:MAG: hypothetical protein PVH68_03400 [Armatimonadota bacterium]|jgi:hypothetical protein
MKAVRGVGALAMVLLLAASGALGLRIIRRPVEPAVEAVTSGRGVEVVDRSGIGDGLWALMVEDIVAVAKEAMERTLPGHEIERIRVMVSRGRAWHENVVTDREEAIYVRIGGHGIGEALRADAGPIALLCEAVADLYNTRRLPGLNRYIAHRYLVPAVVEQVGDDIIPTAHPSPLGPDGVDMLKVMTEDEYTFVHPDTAAVAALMAIEERLGLDGLRGLLAAVPVGDEDALGTLRAAAVRADAELAGAFAAYDEATRLEPDAEGSCLVASFEPDEGADFTRLHPFRTRAQSLLLDTNPGVEWSFTDEWATHGTHSVKLEGDPEDEWLAVYIRDPDWRFRDLRQFSHIELDFVVDATDPQHVYICLNDHVSDGHGQIQVFSKTVLPSVHHHVEHPLTEENLQGFRDMDAEYFSGEFRADSVARLYIGLSKPTQDITLYVDNIRLRPRKSPEPMAGRGGFEAATRSAL